MKIVVVTGLANRSFQPPPETGFTLGSRFLTVASRRAMHPAIVTNRQNFSYGAISAAALSIAQYLRRQPGFLVGTRAALIAPNGAGYLAAIYGITLAGGVAVPISVRLDHRTLHDVLTDADITLLITEPSELARVRAAYDAPIEELSLEGPPPTDFKMESETTNDRSRPALILYTSGSTGTAKGVVLSHDNLVSNAESILGYLPIGPEDRGLALLPFCHAFGNSVLLTHILAGATLVVDGSTTFPNTIVDALEQHEATSFAGVPEMYGGLLKCSDLGARKLPRLKYMTVAGAAMAPAAALAVADRIAPARFFVMYGQTEATARLAYLASDELTKRPSSIGHAIPGVELEVRNGEGKPVGLRQIGELCARGPSIMLGYWRDAASTAQVLEDGWLHTGDLATVDADGFFYVVGRAREQVKIRGLKVSPDAVATTLRASLPENELAVVPFQHQGTWRLALFIVGIEDGGPSLRRVRRVCGNSLLPHERPSHIEFVERLPLTPSLKIDRAALAAMAAQAGPPPFATRAGNSPARMKEAA